MTDLGNLGKTSIADAINSKGQIVGASRIDDVTVHAFLWENGGPMIDLNTLIPPNSSLQLIRALAINDREEISGSGVPPGCGDEGACGHAYVLIPCDEHHPGVEGCDYSMVEASTSVPQTSPAMSNATSRTPPQLLMRRMGPRRPFPGTASGPRN
jgi:probable HAF family extracellular repeat protein